MNENQYEDDNQQIPIYGGVPQMPRSDRADLLDKIKPETIVDIIRHRLLGQELINGEWESVPALKDLALTEVGAWDLSNLMLGTASINVSISKLNDSEIKYRVNNICKTVQYRCIAKWKAYGIKDSSHLWYINAIFFTNALVVLKQADGASIQELLKGTVTENRNVDTRVNQPGRFRRMLGL
jgi:hypothetical protein